MARILVVDDEPDILASMEDLLAHMGHEALTSSTSDAALVLAADAQPDLILHDLRMPGLSVSGMIAALRSDPATANIPLVLFSAHNDLKATVARYNVWGALSKPFAPEELQVLLHRVLGDQVAAPTQRSVDALFSDVFNSLTALSLAAPPEPSPGTDLHPLLVSLEAKMDRLHAVVDAVMRDAFSPAARPDPRPLAARPRRPAGAHGSVSRAALRRSPGY